MSAAEACIEFRAGVGSLPYLADHGFQDMLVLPGSFYLELARRLARERWRRPARALRNVSFDRPIVLGAEDALIRLDVTEHGDGRASCAFREAAGDDAARLEIELDAPGAPGPAAGPFSIDAFQAQSDEVLAAERFYAMLRENGNQYGPSFQRVAALWRTAHEALGKISLPPRDGDADAQALHPSVLDALIQVLASLVIDAGRTFVLRSIERVELPGRDLPDTLWAHAVRLRGGGGETSLVGDVRAFDRSGRACLELCGVELALLERAGGNERSTAESVVVAANFTADPVEDSLRFWGEHFGAPLRVGFAPYDQVFQQLLDPGSALRANRDGVNVVLLALEEWAARDGQAGMTLDSERAQRCFAGRSRYLLPNGLEIVHLNRYETDYLYQEVFEDQCYLRHGIALPDGATVLDIGANIGLFSLFVLSRCRNPRIYAFEPAPAVYELLQANCEAYGAANVRAVNLGVSDQARTASLTFYEKSSVFSGFYADEAADRAALQAVVRNTLSRETAAEDESVAEYVTELTADRLRGTAHECRLTSVSDIIREHRLDRIDLLKIDAEKSELDIIKGIGDDDWPKIAQLVVEIHDPSYESVRRIRTLLGAKGFRCEVEHEQMLEHSGLFNLYAIRDDAPAASRASRARRLSDGLQRNVREFCAALGGFMQQSAAPLILCLCPRTPAAEADRELSAALSDAERSLLAQAGATANVHALGSDTALRRYPVADYYDPDGHRLGHIPYTPACYAAIGTALYRTIFNLRRKPYKVIVLDCDNTLWQGACGEDGPLGVELSEPYRGLQQFMLGQMNAGMLLCLCSKNNEQDVLQVFDRRSDMVLRREHLVSWRINWNRKSDNLRSLADELGLGLDSFIFVDDNPVECADVRASCPGVLTLQLPQAGESFAAFLDHVWAFDHAGGTEEDRARTRMYRESAQRRQFRARSGGLKEFIDGLELRVSIGPPEDDELGRVSQLTFRTNQFNFAALARSEQEIRAFLRRECARCLAVRVADRFGDYGLVGVVLYEAQDDRYKVDTLLLSCRVLGRGVEHALLSQLGRQALEENRRLVELGFRPSERNAPAREFIDRLGAQDGQGTDGSRVFSAVRLAGLAYQPDEALPAPAAAASSRRAADAGPGDRSDALQRIAQGLRDIDRLADAIERQRCKGKAPAAAADAAPAGTLQAALLDIWRRVLGRTRIGLDENFFDAGGSSLRAVQVIAAIRKELNRNLPLVSLFECPTLSLLAARLDPACGEPGSAPASARAALRGRQRRSVMRRKAA